MSEGWKNLKKEYQEKTIAYADEEYALDLMREMAEALEQYSDACHKGYGRDIEPIDRVLKKFKEWK